MGLQEQKMKLIEKIHSLDNVLKGSIYEMKRMCGKPNCVCAKTNTPHTSLFLSFSFKGKTRLVPIKEDQIPMIRTRIKDYKELRAAIDELVKVNAELLRSQE